MKRQAVVLLVLLTATASGGARQTFRAAVDVVRLPVVVLAKDGKPVRGLLATDFEVLENGHPEPVTFFAEGAPGADGPLHLGLMLDRSESMELDLRASSDAAVKFIDTLEEAADVTLVEFASRVDVGRFSPSSYPQLFARIRQGQLGTRTALYDALARYVETTFTREGQHVLLVYTDGGDSASRLTAADIQRMLRMGRVLVYAIGYLENQSSVERARQRAVLTQLSRETGGEAFFPSTAKDMDAIYAKIRGEIEARYTLGYVPTDPKQNGRFRKIEVRLRDAPAIGGRIRTRSGYIASVGN
jgi:Ca-activated chloride channel homolog